MSGSPSVLFIGTSGVFSAAALKALLSRSIAVNAVVLRAPQGALWAGPGLEPLPAAEGPRPESTRPLPLAEREAHPTALDIARTHCIPLLAAGSLGSEESRRQLAQLAPDLIVTACCPEILTPEFLRIPRFGGWNIHPSLLPLLRGPHPLFWSLRLGHTESGVTVHRLEARVDAGAVLEQCRLSLATGRTGAELEAGYAARGGELLAGRIAEIAAGRAHTTPQNEAEASYHPWPGGPDFELDRRWPASRAFRFARAVSSWGQPYVVVGGCERPVLETLAWTDSERQVEDVQEGDFWRLRCCPGILTVHL